MRRSNEQWQQVSHLLIDSALAQPQVLVHRDYMPRNLMLSEPNPGVLDFQDAVYGPVTYDVTCLFKDAFLSWPEASAYVAGWNVTGSRHGRGGFRCSQILKTSCAPAT